MQTCIRVALTASTALQSAASQSQHVVNMLTAEDPVSPSDVSELSKKEAEITGDTQKGGTAAQAQVSIEVHQPALHLALQGVDSVPMCMMCLCAAKGTDFVPNVHHVHVL